MTKISVIDAFDDRTSYILDVNNKVNITIKNKSLEVAMANTEVGIEFNIDGVLVELDYSEIEAMYILLRHYMKENDLNVIIEEEY